MTLLQPNPPHAEAAAAAYSLRLHPSVVLCMFDVVSTAATVTGISCFFSDSTNRHLSKTITVYFGVRLYVSNIIEIEH